MADFLLELLSEEIPARMQGRARADLARLFAEGLQKAGLATAGIETFSTPRRLVLIARGLPEATEAVSEEVKGPRATAPEQALASFHKKTGLKREQLEERDGVLFAKIDRPGRSASEVLAEVVEAIVRDFPWPKSMRWGSGNLRWVRPLHGIVALLGEEIVRVEVDGIAAGAATVGHRFHHPGPITIGSCADYAEKLRACHVIVDQEEREALIRDGAAKVAKDAGLALVEDEGLVVENAGLTEWPVALLGRFDADFLDVPREVIVLTMRTNQKYFACNSSPSSLGEVAAAERLTEGPLHQTSSGPPPRDKLGEELAPAFVCVANIDASDGGAAIVEGNKRVLAARLADARFFWEQDLKVPLEERLPELERTVFFEGLGTYREKAARIAELAAHIAKNYVAEVDPQLAGKAAELAKADLVSGTVGEFPELQGVIGGYLARNLANDQAEAISSQYRDDPQGTMAQVVGIADRIDTLVAFFARNQKPTGSKDPFALRRAALQTIKIINDNALRLPLLATFKKAEDGLVYDEQGLSGSLDAAELLDFFADRLKVQQREAGVRHDLIDAVFTLGDEDDLVRLLARVKALQAFVTTEEGVNLLTGYKRAANILKKEHWDLPRVMATQGEQGIPQTGEEDPLVLVEEPAIAEAVAEMASGSATPDDAPAEEKALVAALDEAEPRAKAAVAAEDFTGAMAALASLRAPIDAFFEHVTVNDPDKSARARRLNLLARFRDAVHQVADFSRIEG